MPGLITKKKSNDCSNRSDMKSLTSELTARSRSIIRNSSGLSRKRWRAARRSGASCSAAPEMEAIAVHEFSGPEAMRIANVSTPTPAADEVLVRLRAIGVNPVDTYIRSGAYARAAALPYTPGSDGAGVVEQTGNAVTAFKRG